MNKIDEVSKIILLGMNHKTAPVEVRERFTCDEKIRQSFMSESRACGIDEIVYLSTCNRVEIYFTAVDVHEAMNRLGAVIAQYTGLHENEFSPYIYKKYSRDAVRHLLTVASSLDSMVVGETEILSQIKQAYRDSVHGKNSGILLNRLFHQAFNTAKKVRTDTGIAQNPLSIAYIAVEQAREIFGGDLSARKALLIGAGEMGELILKYFTKCCIGDITIANRSLSNAEVLAESINTSAHIAHLDDIDAVAKSADIIISSVSVNDPIITTRMAENIAKEREDRPLFMIDIGVPRNIDPSVASVPGVHLYNIDNLKKIADENLRYRLKEVEVARQIVESDATTLLDWYEGLEIVPLIVELQENFEAIRLQELDKYRRRKLKHLNENDMGIVEELTKQILSKILHNPIMKIKENKQSGVHGYHSREAISQKIKVIEELFK